MLEEIHALDENGTWNFVDLLVGKKDMLRLMRWIIQKLSLLWPNSPLFIYYFHKLFLIIGLYTN
ncbi:Retrovirus-related Pol polyprotein from transposon TNT 1-94 [Gossypium australe]|uniref:Retrovirus-related Pol polyprotein from transposon TNT 1-94 n=1 Tax=Gossypium australe TaxID=47621 RepID=A0A5B6VMX3_9ROSI|nr:Retrovirus-related Pol polyprotein from transposon TNT 1-94 [Gossypium australe]